MPFIPSPEARPDQKKLRRFFARSLLLVSMAVCSFGQTAYQNPVIPGDYPDPSIIRVGDDYYATATTSEWAPLFPILHSRDLVNWTNTGNVFQKRPDWAVGNFWAPEIARIGNKYFIYYVGRKRNGPLSIAVATADQPTGPYTDHGPMIGQDAGSIDPVPVEDENGRLHLIWKEDGNSRNQPTPLWIQPLSADGTRLTGEMREILRNDPQSWEGRVIEGPFVIRRNGYFYLFYAGNACCGRGCHYGVGVARAKNLLGPWEKNPNNPLVVDNAIWKCPGHGSLVQDQRGDYYFLYHAYHADDFVYAGRQAVLDKVEFSAGGWPVINQGKGTAFSAAAPLKQPARHAQFDFEDEFIHPSLHPDWQWPQNNEPLYEISKQASGSLRLRPNPTRAENRVGAVLAVKTASGTYVAQTVVNREHWVSSAVAGLSAFGDMDNAVGLAVAGNKLQLWRRAQKKDDILHEQELPPGDRLFLQLACRDGHKLTFSTSLDGQHWTPVPSDKPLEGNYLPPWDRGTRVALTVGGGKDAAATFESMKIHFDPPRLSR